MFDVWDWGPNYSIPVENKGGSGSSSGFNLQETINRALDVLGARFGQGGYISPDDPRYGQGGYGSYPYDYRNQATAAPYTTVGATFTPLAIGVGLLVLFMFLKKK